MYACVRDITALDIPYIVEENNKIAEVNILFLELTGYEEKDILGRKVEDIWDHFLRINADYYKIKEFQKCEGFMFTINRIVMEVTIRYYEVPGLDRCIYTFMQKKNCMFEEQFPFLELVNLANNNGIAVCSVPDFILLKANKTYFEYFSKSYIKLEDILGRSLYDIMPSLKNSRMHKICLDAIQSGQPVFCEEQLIELPGMGKTYIRYTLTPIYEDGAVKYLVFIHNDVTDKVESIEAIFAKNRIIEEQKKSLEAQRDYLYKLFNALELPIISLSYPNFKVAELNKKAFSELRELSGVGDIIIESYLMGKSLSESVQLVNTYAEAVFIEQLEKSKSTICHEKMEMMKNGNKVYYNITYHPLLDIKGEITEILVVVIDVTREVEKRKQMEDVLKLKDEFFYLMSHEFKTPLTVINAAVQSLEYIYGKQIPEKAKVLVEKVKQNAFIQLRLVNNLLDITRINSGKIKLKKRNIDIVLLARVITESVAIHAQQKGVEISFTSKLSCKVIGIDDEKFERILLNLLSNAIKFTPEGKRVDVELSAKLHKNKRMVCIKVKDQGIGIPIDKQALIFDRFGQVDSILARQAEGTGIGLFLVKLMVDALDGEILLESEEGKGSIFTLMIPSKRIKEDAKELESKCKSDSRLIQSLAIEFSDVYL